MEGINVFCLLGFLAAFEVQNKIAAISFQYFQFVLRTLCYLCTIRVSEIAEIGLNVVNSKNLVENISGSRLFSLSTCMHHDQT